MAEDDSPKWVNPTENSWEMHDDVEDVTGSLARVATIAIISLAGLLNSRIGVSHSLGARPTYMRIPRHLAGPCRRV